MFLAGMIVSVCGLRTRVPVFLYCNYLMVWVMIVLLVVLTEHILLGELCVWFFFCLFCLGVVHETDRCFSKKYYYQFPNTILLSSGFSWMSLIWLLFFIFYEGKKSTLKIPVASLNTPVVFFPLFNVSAILWTCLDV